MTHSKDKPARIFITILFAVYLFFLVNTVLCKLTSIFELGSLDRIRSLNYIPFVETVGMLADPTVSMSTFLLNVLGNIAIFVPLGLFIPLYCKQHYVRTTFIAALLTSVAFEAIQYVLAIGITDIDDVIFNVAGAMLGVGIYVLAKRSLPRKDLLMASIMAFLTIDSVASLVVAMAW